jgi:hypothetical protein
MGTRSRFLKHVFQGGWATDFGGSVSLPISPGGTVTIPWLTIAENITFELDGGPHKMPGRKTNTAALEAGADIMGVFDAWFVTTGTPVQHRLLNVGTKLKKDDADNVFTDIKTGLVAGAVPCYTMFEGICIISNDSGTDVPQSWNGVAAATSNLAGSPPTFAFSVTHKNKVWAAGDPTQPSRLYYSVTLNGADWIGAGSGTIDVDPADGDRITGLISHRDDLWVFKGPYKGSIHRITGSSPSDFARVVFATSIGAVNHRSIAAYANDVVFQWSDASYHTLSATASFGDFNETALSRQIQSWLRDHVALQNLRFSQVVNWNAYSLLIFVLPVDASTSNNCTLMLDYRFDPPRWVNWAAYRDLISLATGIDTTTSKTRTLLAGGTDGILRTLGQVTRNIDGSASIPFHIQTPYLDYQVAHRFKTLEGASVTIQPKSAGQFVFGWMRDSLGIQTVNMSQNGGTILGVFLLGTDSLGGGRSVDEYTRLNEEGGTFRQIAFDVLDNVADQDLELHAFSAEITVDAESYE